MAIGSEPEAGKSFGSCRDFTMEDWEEWWAWMRANWYPNLLAGYATLVTYESMIRAKDEQQ